MELAKAIEARKSIRGYKPTPVPKEVLTEILDLARRAPSGINLQPWEFIVLTGGSLEVANRVTIAAATSGAPIDVDVPGYQIVDPYRQRQAALGKEMFRALGIGRDDVQKRTEWSLRGMRFHGAPAGLLICLDEKIFHSQSPMALVDVGLITQTIALLAVEHGLGTCIQGQVVMYASTLRKALDIPQSKRLILGMAIGYPDGDFPANKMHSGREPLESLVTWKG